MSEKRPLIIRCPQCRQLNRSHNANNVIRCGKCKREFTRTEAMTAIIGSALGPDFMDRFSK